MRTTIAVNRRLRRLALQHTSPNFLLAGGECGRQFYFLFFYFHLFAATVLGCRPLFLAKFPFLQQAPHEGAAFLEES